MMPSKTFLTFFYLRKLINLKETGIEKVEHNTFKKKPKQFFFFANII